MIDESESEPNSVPLDIPMGFADARPGTFVASVSREPSYNIVTISDRHIHIEPLTELQEMLPSSVVGIVEAKNTVEKRLKLTSQPTSKKVIGELPLGEPLLTPLSPLLIHAQARTNAKPPDSYYKNSNCRYLFIIPFYPLKTA